MKIIKFNVYKSNCFLNIKTIVYFKETALFHGGLFILFLPGTKDPPAKKKGSEVMKASFGPINKANLSCSFAVFLRRHNVPSTLRKPSSTVHIYPDLRRRETVTDDHEPLGI